MCRRIEERVMKILAINGSPKGNRSNTWRLTCAFLEGITIQEEKGGAQAPEIETLIIGSLNLKPCLGCFRAGTRRQASVASTTICRELSIKFCGLTFVVWSFPLILLWIARSAENPHRPSASYVPPVHVYGNGKRRASILATI